MALVDAWKAARSASESPQASADLSVSTDKSGVADTQSSILKRIRNGIAEVKYRHAQRAYSMRFFSRSGLQAAWDMRSGCVRSGPGHFFFFNKTWPLGVLKYKAE